LAVVVGGCTAGEGSGPGTSQGAAGTSGAAGVQGAAGTSGAAGVQGAAGNGGAAGVQGEAGTSGAAGNGGVAGTSGAAGNGGAAGTSGAAGTNGAAGTTGKAGTGGGAAGTGGGAAGTGGGAAGTGGGLAKRSEGCGLAPPAGDKDSAFIKHDIMVTGVSQSYIAAHPLATTGVAPYSFTARNYFVRLPTGYDTTKAYRVVFGGPGCGGNATVGVEGGYTSNTHADQLQVSLSYVPTAGNTTATNPGSCFADGAADSPEVPYFDAVLAEVSKKYCVDLSNVGVQGYSSGAWEGLLLGWARAGVVRGIAVEAGGLRNNRPPGTNKPVAAMMIATNGDTENPIDLKAGDAKAVELGALGSGQARDEILRRNGCTGTATAMWDADYPLCQKYTGCPAAYPVVWCLMNTGGHYPAHKPYTPDGMSKFLGSLPAVP
jgi:poly(3-hydroxybutyrate) depolymerase